MLSEEFVKELISIHIRRLQELKKQQAIKGISADPEIQIEIENTEAKIKELEIDAQKQQKSPVEAGQINGIQTKPTQETVEENKQVELEQRQREIDDCLSQEDWKRAVALLDEETLKAFYKSGQSETLARWFSTFPEMELQLHPDLLLWKGNILSNFFSQPKEAMNYFELAERVYRQQNNLLGVAKAQIWKSVSLRMMGNAKEAINLATEGARLMKALAFDKPSLHLAWAIRNRGVAYGTAGKIVQAISDISRALTEYLKLGDRYMEGLCHHDLGVSFDRQGNISLAEYHYWQAKGIWEHLGNQNELANSLTGLGNVLSKLGRYEEALDYLNTVFEIAQKLDSPRRAAFAQASIGKAHFGRKDYQKAMVAYENSTYYAKQAKVHSLEIANQINISECIYYLAQEYTLAKSLKKITEVRHNAQDNSLMREGKLAAIVEAKIGIRLGKYEPSFKLLKEAIVYFVRNKMFEQAVEACLWWAYGLFNQEKYVEAKEHLLEGLNLIPKINSSVHKLKVANTEVMSLLCSVAEQQDMPLELIETINSLRRQLI